MKKLSLIITTVAALALITTACNISLNPPVAPPGPPPVQPQPGQPQPGQPQPGQPQPGQPQPGQPQPGQPPTPGQQPQPPAPGQPPTPGQPPAQVQPTATKSSGGSNPTLTATTGPQQATIVKIDLQATDLDVDTGDYVHVRIKNNSSYSGDISFDVSCTGYYGAVWGGFGIPISYPAHSVTYHFNANEERNTNSNIHLDKGKGYYNLTCKVSMTLDPDPSNNSVTETLQVAK